MFECTYSVNHEQLKDEQMTGIVLPGEKCQAQLYISPSMDHQPIDPSQGFNLAHFIAGVKILPTRF